MVSTPKPTPNPTLTTQEKTTYFQKPSSYVSEEMINQIGPVAQNTFDVFCSEFRKDENQHKIKVYVIDPLIKHIADKLQPYVMTTICAFVIFFLLIIIILILLIKNNSI